MQSATSGHRRPYSPRLQHHRPKALVMAALTTWLVTSVDEYPQNLKRFLASPGPHYVVFNADTDPVSGQPWCPDCVRTVPAIRDAVAHVKGSLLEVQVGGRPEWKNPKHPFRLDPELHLGSIPTLLKLNDQGKEVARLSSELEDTKKPTAVSELLARFISNSTDTSE